MGRPEWEGLKPYRTAAQCIDWTLHCPSIFLTPEEAKVVGCKRPLAEATLRRIANGIRRYVIEASEPFIVRTGHWSNITGKGKGFRGQSPNKPLSTIHCTNDYGLCVPSLAGVGGRAGQSRPRGVDEPMATATTKADTGLVAPIIAPVTHQGDRRCNSPAEPLPTVTGAKRGEQAVVSSVVVPIANYDGRDRANGVDEPLTTVTAHPKGGSHALAAAFLAKYNSQKGNESVCNNVAEPLRTQTTENRHAVVAAHLTYLRGTNKRGNAADEPCPTITGGGTHIAEVRAFLCAYYGNDKEGQALREPLRTATTKERFGLVMVNGEPHEIVDIGMRMLIPRELARAQGFPDEYRIDAGPNGRTLTKTEQVMLIGNSVCPDVAEALVAANYVEPSRAVEVSA